MEISGRYISFIIAIVITFFGFYWFFLPHKDYRRRKMAILWYIAVLFIFLAGAIFLWTSQHLYKVVVSYETLTEEQRDALLKEAKSNLTAAEAIVLGTMAIFIPLLLTLWNSFNREFTDGIRNLVSLQENKHVDQRELERVLGLAKQEYSSIMELGQVMQIFFWIGLGSLIIKIALISSASSISTPQVIYLWNNMAKLLSEIGLLFFIFLLTTHVLLVQPTLGLFYKIDFIAPQNQ